MRSLILIVVGLDDDPIMSAVLRMSKSELGNLLRLRDDLSSIFSTIQDKDLERYLRASIGWPDGMRIVVNCMHTRRRLVCDEWCLMYAYYLKHWDSVDLLLQLGWRISYYVLNIFSRSDGEILQRLVQDIWRHRGTFQLQPETSSQRYHDPVESRWIFHLQLPVTTANPLYDIGFRDLDTERGYISDWGDDFQYLTTPLWKLAQNILTQLYKGYSHTYFSCSVDELLNGARWLIDKGANIAWSHPHFQTSPAHLLPIASFRKLDSLLVVMP